MHRKFDAPWWDDAPSHNIGEANGGAPAALPEAEIEI